MAQSCGQHWRAAILYRGCVDMWMSLVSNFETASHVILIMIRINVTYELYKIFKKLMIVVKSCTI